MWKHQKTILPIFSPVMVEKMMEIYQKLIFPEHSCLVTPVYGHKRSELQQ